MDTGPAMDKNLERSGILEQQKLPDPTQPSADDIPVSTNTPLDGRQLQSSLTLIKLGLRTNLRWLDREQPDVNAAMRTINRLIEEICRLETEIVSMRV